MCPGIRFPVIAIIMESRALVFMPHQLTDFVDVDFTGVYQCADVGLADFVHGLHRGHGMAAIFPYPAVKRSGMDALSVFSQEDVFRILEAVSGVPFPYHLQKIVLPTCALQRDFP